ncbi:MAG: hemolysin family protein [Treponema sp.]|jgi:putative hemolysin|nr:hemolysin family protein [Treponema sp.]
MNSAPAGEPPLSAILIILGIIVLGGLFSLIERALVSSRKPRLRAKAETGDRKYRRALEAAENSGPLLSALRIWGVFLGILAGAFGGIRISWFLGACLKTIEALAPYGDFLAAAALALVLTPLSIILGEALPKQLALGAPEKILARTLPLIRVLSVFCAPLTAGVSRFSGMILRALGIGHAPDPGMTEDELRIALIEGEKSGIVESEERTMVEGVFYLGDRPVGTFMTHRSEIEWLDINSDREEVRAAALAFREQRYFPVAAGTLDEVAGVVSVQDILLALLEEPWRGLKAITRPPYFVPETMSALKAFESFKKGEADFLFVMDEYGGFSGVLSVLDLFEEIVGELSASTQEEEGILRQEDGTYLADGSVNIDDIVKLLALGDLPGDHQEYHTLAGFVLELAGEIPRTGASFQWNGFSFKIVDMDGNRIDKILMSPPEN